MLPLSVPSYDEDRLQMSIGTISGVAQWTANTASDWAKYAGGIHGTEDMSFLETYNLHMQADASFRQSAARTIETSLGADLDNPFYQYSFQGAYMGADFAYAAMIPFPKFSKAGKAIQGVQRHIKNPDTKKAASIASKIFNRKPSLSPAKRIDLVIEETLINSGAFSSNYKLSSTEALEAGMQFLGKNYVELGKNSGVYRSADKLRQFRIDKNSLIGNHGPNAPHFHLETFKSPYLRYPNSNNHILFYD